MVTPKHSASPAAGTYRVEVAAGEKCSTFTVMRCEPVAQFDNEEHAAFLVELLQQDGKAHG